MAGCFWIHWHFKDDIVVLRRRVSFLESLLKPGPDEKNIVIRVRPNDNKLNRILDTLLDESMHSGGVPEKVRAGCT